MKAGKQRVTNLDRPAIFGLAFSLLSCTLGVCLYQGRNSSCTLWYFLTLFLVQINNINQPKHNPESCASRSGGGTTDEMSINLPRKRGIHPPAKEKENAPSPVLHTPRNHLPDA